MIHTNSAGGQYEYLDLISDLCRGFCSFVGFMTRGVVSKLLPLINQQG